MKLAEMDNYFVKNVIEKAETEIEKLTGRPVTLHITKIVCSPENLQRLKDLTAEHFGIPWANIIKRDRHSDIIEAKHSAAWLLATLFEYSSTEVAGMVGLKDHTSVLHALEKIEGFYQVRDPLIKDIEIIKAKLLN